MMNVAKVLVSAISLTLFSSLALPARSEQVPPLGQDVEAQRKAAEEKARPNIEQHRKDAEQEAAKSVDKDAADSVTETQNANKAIDANNKADALAAIERAIGKITILLTRHPASALVPVGLEVAVINVAPQDRDNVKSIAKTAEKAVSDKEYPKARGALFGLVSEIRTRTYNLPLATYPAALAQAASLIEQNKMLEAKTLLMGALGTLVVIDRAMPLPLVFAKVAITDAEAMRDKDRDGARKLLTVASAELERAKDLGYAANDQEYTALDKQIGELDKQLKGKEDTSSAFTRLKDRINAFYKRGFTNGHR